MPSTVSRAVRVCVSLGFVITQASLTPRAVLAQGPSPRVTLVDPGAELERAVRASLEPWSADIHAVPPPSPSASMPGTAVAARAVAEQSRAAAVVWVSEHEGGFALWIYDVASDQVTAQALTTPPPFDAPTAAGVALSIKTLLRHSAVAPRSERFGAADGATTGVTGRSGRPARAPAVPREPPASRSHGSRVDLEARAGMRVDRTDPGAIDARLALGCVWWPGRDLAGLAIRVGSGPGLVIDDARVRGRLVDTEASVGGALRYTFGEVVRTSAAAAVALHLSWLDGTLPSNGREVDVVRVDPSLDVELGIDWLASRWLRVGVRGALSWLPLVARYLVRGVPVLALSSVSFEAALVLGAMLPE
jgi:hypothetical protein